tara:strand:- start:3185 stop:4789 length:1605 start_codon:yes stop_codon:yes gene_type:complete
MAIGDSPLDRMGIARQGLLIAGAIVAFGFLGSRLLGLARTAIIANEFGASPELDAYWVAFRIPDLIFQVLAGATLGSAFIPVFTRLYRGKDSTSAWKLASNVLTIIFLATTVLCLLALALAPWLVPIFAPGLGEDIGRGDQLTAEAVKLTRIMLISPLLLSVSGIITGILNARQQFFLPAIAPSLYNLGIIIGAVALSGRFGVEGLAIGVVIGSAAHLVIQIPGLVKERMRYAFRTNLRDGPTLEVAKLMGPRVLGLAAAQANFVVTTTFFASKVGTSAISNLTFAWLIANLPVALFGMALSTAAFPRLAEQAADADHRGLVETVSRVLRTILFFAIPAALGIAFLREPATTVLLERGAFGASETAITSAALGFLCLGIVPQAAIEIHSRGFYALGDTRTPVLLTIASVLMNVTLSAILWERFAVEGLAISLSVASWLEWGVLFWLYSLRTGSASSTFRDLHAISRITAAAAAMALFLGVVLPTFDEPGTAAAWVTVFAAAIAGLAVYLAICLLLRVEEVLEGRNRILSLLRPH